MALNLDDLLSGGPQEMSHMLVKGYSGSEDLPKSRMALKRMGEIWNKWI